MILIITAIFVILVNLAFLAILAILVILWYLQVSVIIEGHTLNDLLCYQKTEV